MKIKIDGIQEGVVDHTQSHKAARALLKLGMNKFGRAAQGHYSSSCVFWDSISHSRLGHPRDLVLQVKFAAQGAIRDTLDEPIRLDVRFTDEDMPGASNTRTDNVL